MNELFPPLPLLAAFVGASLVLAVTPGPGVLYIVTRSMTQGRRCGLVSVAGVAAGNWCNAIGASIGLATLFAVSTAAFTVVKWAGAAYLIFLGIKKIRSGDRPQPVAMPASAPVEHVFRDGFVVALLNPKTAVFFAAFLPQFMTLGGNTTLQGVLLGSLFVLIAALTDSAYVVAASFASRLLSNSQTVRRGGRFLTGGVFVGLGIYTAVTGNRKPG